MKAGIREVNKRAKTKSPNRTPTINPVIAIHFPSLPPRPFLNCLKAIIPKSQANIANPRKNKQALINDKRASMLVSLFLDRTSEVFNRSFQVGETFFESLLSSSTCGCDSLGSKVLVFVFEFDE